MLWLIVVNHGRRDVVRDLEPRTYLKGTFGPDVIFLVVLVADLVDAVHAVVASGHVVVGELIATGHGKIVLVGPVAVLVEQIVPVCGLHICPSEHPVPGECGCACECRVCLSADELVVDLLGVRHSAVNVVEQRLRAVVVPVVGVFPPVEPGKAVRDHIRYDSPAVHRDRTVVVYHGPSFLRILRGHEDDTERSSGSVHGR